ncbi:DUF6640 family protein [Brevundimonas sp.]|uniref:DUF6640 family protein n=1 Tax=Brevundimonas sp. TaxID=1871086 RepID=UPI00286C9D75|nr:DUF6640 family protein [Brevundimonas sp.]
MSDVSLTDHHASDTSRRRAGWRSVPVALTAVVLVVLIPLLEVNASHLVNPEWPAHARFHEAWQLLTNAGLAVMALWLALCRRQERMAAGLCLVVVGSLLAAHLLGSLYGGEISRPGSDEFELFGLSSPVLILSVLAVGLVAAIWPAGAKSIRS